MTAGITDPEVQQLAGIAATLQSDYLKSDDDPWEGSPFAWILACPSRQRGAIGERLVAGWCAAKGADVVRSTTSAYDREINSQRVEIKFSTLWKAGGFKFQQIRDQDYDQLLCLGIMPFDAACWVIPKPVLHEHVIGRTGQHTGRTGAGTAWISFQAGSPPEWMAPYGGSLAEAWRVLAALG